MRKENDMKYWICNEMGCVFFRGYKDALSYMPLSQDNTFYSDEATEVIDFSEMPVGVMTDITANLGYTFTDSQKAEVWAV